MIRCGALDDVYPYEKMKHQRGNESSPPHATTASGRKKTMFFESAPQSPTATAKLGGEKTSSFRWICQHIVRVGDSISLGGSKRVSSSMQDGSTSASMPTTPRTRKGQPSKRIGFIDILMGYHSLLQAGAAYPVPRQRRELHPTVGFIPKPDGRSHC